VEPSKFRIFLCIVFTELGHFHFLLTEWHDGVIMYESVLQSQDGVANLLSLRKKGRPCPKKSQKEPDSSFKTYTYK